MTQRTALSTALGTDHAVLETTRTVCKCARECDRTEGAVDVTCQDCMHALRGVPDELLIYLFVRLAREEAAQLCFSERVPVPVNVR